jgi:hypothetical protein
MQKGQKVPFAGMQAWIEKNTKYYQKRHLIVIMAIPIKIYIKQLIIFNF